MEAAQPRQSSSVQPRRPSRGTPDPQLGTHISVYWEAESQWFDGKVTRYVPSNGKHEVSYTDGDVRLHNLQQERWRVSAGEGNESTTAAEPAEAVEAVEAAEAAKAEAAKAEAAKAEAAKAEAAKAEAAEAEAAEAEAAKAAQAAETIPLHNDLLKMKVPELKGLLQGLGQDASGKKDSLVERLVGLSGETVVEKKGGEQGVEQNASAKKQKKVSGYTRFIKSEQAHKLMSMITPFPFTHQTRPVHFRHDCSSRQIHAPKLRPLQHCSFFGV